MTIFSIIAVIVTGCFGFVLFFGAPYLPTLNRQVAVGLRLSGLKPGQHLLELGCGDGKVLIAAAKQGIRATGYELNPLVFTIAWLRTRRYRKLVIVHCGDFWRANWPPADAIFVFLLPKFMSKLDTKVAQYAKKQPKKVRLVSFAFTIDKTPVRNEQGLFVYDYKN